MTNPTNALPPVTPDPEPAPEPTPTPSAKLIPESDLLAVKAAAKKEQTRLEAQVAEANTNAANLRSQVLDKQAAYEQVETKYKELTATQEEAVKVKAERDAALSRSKKLEEQLLGMRKQSIAATYGVEASKLEGKTLEQLDLMDDALKTVGPVRKKTTYATGLTSTGAGEMTAMEGAKAAIAKAKERAGVPTS